MTYTIHHTEKNASEDFILQESTLDAQGALEAATSHVERENLNVRIRDPKGEWRSFARFEEAISGDGI